MTRTLLYKSMLLLCFLLTGALSVSGSKEMLDDTPTHTVTFYVNGGVYSTANVTEDAAIPFPSNPSNMGGKVFMGWTTTQISSTTNTEPTYVTTATMGAADQNYYAVFATKSVSPLLFKTYQKITTGLSNWTGTYLLGATTESRSTSMFTGAGSDNSKTYGIAESLPEEAITFFNTEHEDYELLITKVSDNNEYTIYYKKSGYYFGYHSNHDLAFYPSYNPNSNNQKWKITGASGTITHSNSHTIQYKPGSTPKFGCFTSETATNLYKRMEEAVTTYTDYCTNSPATINAAVTGAGWATFIPSFDVSFSGVKAYIVTNTDNSEATLTEVEDVPAGTPVLLHGAAGTYTLTVIDNSSTDTSANCLYRSTGQNPGGDMYVLAKPNNDLPVGFYLWDKATGGNLGAGKVYMRLRQASATRQFIALPGEETGIEDVNVNENRNENDNDNENRVVYDLQGRRVMQPTKGLYIVNGKKVVLH